MKSSPDIILNNPITFPMNRREHLSWSLATLIPENQDKWTVAAGGAGSPIPIGPLVLKAMKLPEGTPTEKLDYEQALLLGEKLEEWRLIQEGFSKNKKTRRK